MRWSTVCGEMSSSAAISLDDRCSLTSRRQSSCPALRRATRASISSPAELSSPSAVSGTRGHSSKANPTPNAMALLSITSPALNLFHNGEVGQISADFRELCRKGIGGAYSGTLRPLVSLAFHLFASPPTGCAREWWRGLDSNQRTLARADLQSAAFNHSATSPQRSGRRAMWRRCGGVSTRSNERSAGLSPLRSSSSARSKIEPSPGWSRFWSG